MIIGLIGAVWGIINFFSNLFQIGQGIVLATTLINNFSSYLPTIKTWLGYVLFFVPPSVLFPLLGVSIAMVGWRIGTAIVNLIWW